MRDEMASAPEQFKYLAEQVSRAMLEKCPNESECKSPLQSPTLNITALGSIQDSSGDGTFLCFAVYAAVRRMKAAILEERELRNIAEQRQDLASALCFHCLRG